MKARVEAVVLVSVIVAIVFPFACAALGVRQGTVDHNRLEVPVTAAVQISPELTAALGKIEELEAALAKLEIAMGDITVGGDGDSVTTWMLVLTVAAALFYPVIGRPIRLKLQRRMKDEG